MARNKEIILDTVKEPASFPNVPPTFLTDETMNERKTKVLNAMKKEGFQVVAVYADKEHGSNFEYVTGFIPRFEEGLLLIEDSGKCTVILGNENLKMAPYSRAAVTLKHSPLFSLPNQPMDNEAPLEEILQEAGLDQKNKIGLVGWKMFTTKKSDPSTYFDLPYFIVEAFKKAKHQDAEAGQCRSSFYRGRRRRTYKE
ncbi:hypothetical protein [Paenibacillus sp. 1P03SA]|uniref:hypothetical protein n=1 Tax=Paenibacillus sp. 1P03SA TaxID=3132294 RepID=UPI0039A36AB9